MLVLLPSMSELIDNGRQYTNCVRDGAGCCDLDVGWLVQSVKDAIRSPLDNANRDRLHEGVVVSV